ncbi:MAG: PaaI family thioesterase [Salibacteraceae bacterium]
MHKILELYNSINQYGTLNELDLTVLSPGHIQYKMPVKKKHLATPIAIHGGVLSAMMDAVLGVAALSASCHDGNLVSTVEFKINYLAPARLGDLLVGEGKVIQKGNRLIIADGNISLENSEKIIAKGIGTFSAYPIEKSGILEHLSLEQKQILGAQYFSELS